jgi:hypothetical protein
MYFMYIRERERVNRSQMDIKRKTYDNRTWKNIYFSTYPPSTLIHLSHRFTSASKPAAQKSFWLLSQPLPHLRFNLFVISETSATFLGPLVNCFTRQTLPTVNRKYFLMNILCIESLCPQRKPHNRKLLLGSTLLKHGRHFDY